MTDKHALTRTSPKGGAFIGTCMKCGEPDLPAAAVGKPCSNPANMTQDEALLLSITGNFSEPRHD